MPPPQPRHDSRSAASRRLAAYESNFGAHHRRPPTYHLPGERLRFLDLPVVAVELQLEVPLARLGARLAAANLADIAGGAAARCARQRSRDVDLAVVERHVLRFERRERA